MRRLVFLLLLSSFAYCLSSQTTNVRHWRASERDSMERALLLYDEENYLMAIPMYEVLYKNHPDEDFLKYVLGNSDLFRSDKHEEAYKLLSQVYAKTTKAEDIELSLAKASHLNYKFDEALSYLEKYATRKHIPVEKRQEAKLLKNYCNNAKDLCSRPNEAKINNIGTMLNTTGDEYVPVISADESVMIYTYRGPNSTGGLQNALQQSDPYGIYYEDVFMSVKDERGNWTAPAGITTINTNRHDAAVAISHDGHQLFIYRDSGDDHGDLYISYLRGGTWTTPEKLRGFVNSYSWDGSCSLAPDGRTLYFSSERGGGYGGKDLYRASMMPDSTWGNITNLGDSVNTPLDDDAPFIHADGVTLFYSSKGKNSMGGYDIFQAHMNLKDSTFSKAANLGSPINTPDDDIYYTVTANSEHGYYASGKSGGQGLKDIYTIFPGVVGKKPSLYVVKGKISEEGVPVEATVSVQIRSLDNRSYSSTYSNQGSGTYFTSLPAGQSYTLIYQYKNWPARKVDIDATDIEGYNEKIHNINFVAKDTMPIAVAAPTPTPTHSLPPTPVIAPVREIGLDNFVPKTPRQIKIAQYANQYGDISADGLIFKVQIAAFKDSRNFSYTHLKGLGKVEKLTSYDGVTRFTIGGNFTTIAEAFEYNKKVILAGQKDAFVTAIYKGRRVYLEDLERMGIFTIKK